MNKKEFQYNAMLNSLTRLIQTSQDISKNKILDILLDEGVDIAEAMTLKASQQVVEAAKCPSCSNGKLEQIIKRCPWCGFETDPLPLN